ncbi:MAG: ABC transporter permease [Chloroflexi bacterium CFX4]|nr:ABC transporter permease [Chloroflexi bacterium CFX4]MDL1921022.1 ABC transporter permease [Chloroflexi bacterium CFX3]
MHLASAQFLPTFNTQRPFLRALHYAANLAILIGAHLIAVQIRLRLPWGNTLGAEYDAQPPLFYGIAAAAQAVAYLLAAWAARTPFAPLLTPRSQFRVLALGIGGTVLGVLLLLPNLSKLQLIYFALAAVLLGVCVIIYPSRVNPAQDGGDFLAHLFRLWQNRALLGLWLRYNIQSRYSQTVVGIFWIVLLPLAMSGVLALAFSQFLRVSYDVPFISFFLAGLVPWGLFSSGIFNGMGAILGKMALINQVNFPREITVLLALGEGLVDLCFTLIALVIVNALNGIFPNAMWIYLPPLLFILICFTLGVMFFLSSMSLIIRDIPQLVGVVMQLLFYLTPILYPVSAIPERFRFIVLLNPVGLVLQAFRDVLVYGRAPDALSLYYPLVAALALLYMGYAYFKANETRLADFA